MQKVRIAALFPGQGSQTAGMAKTLRDQFPFTRALYEEASEAIKFDLLKLCTEGHADDLQLTFNAQPSILVTSYAWFQVLKQGIDFTPTFAAGHSLGEYSALLAAGAMTLTEATRLVRTRGQLMQSAVPPGKGKMAAVIGLSDEKIREVCSAATQGEGSLVVPANYNAPSQVVIAGHTAAVERAESLMNDPKHEGWKARKVVPLKVSAPFHCPLMKGVATEFEAHLKSVKWQFRNFPVAANLDAQLRRDGDLVPLLRDQIDHSVLWVSCVQELDKAGTEVYVEMGPGKVLTGLVKRISETGKTLSVDSLEEFRALEQKAKEDFR